MKTPQRNIRISDVLWRKAQRKAQREGVTVTFVVQRALAQYTAGEEDPG